MLEIEELKKGLAIDVDDLDTELSMQPQKYNDAAEAFAMAVSRRDFLKEKLKEVDATVDGLIRKKHQRDGLTVQAITALVARHKDHLNAAMAYRKSCTAVDILEGIREAYKMRSYALQGLATFWVEGYNQENSVRGHDVNQVGEAERFKLRQEHRRARLKE